MKKIIFILFASFSICSLKAQMYSQPTKTEVKEVKADKTQKKLNPGDKTYLGIGFVLNGTAALDLGTGRGNYKVNYPGGQSYSYQISNTIGYRVGIGVGFQSRSFGLELPISYCVDRFVVRAISTTSVLSIPSLEFGLNQTWRFLKEKHYILLGEYVALHRDNIDWDYPHSIGLNFGYGYCILDKLNVSFRYKFDLLRNYSSLQLVLRYDIVNTRKMKKEEDKKSRRSREEYQNMNAQNNYTPPTQLPTKPIIDYSKYSDSDLTAALKEANAKSDLDGMLGIQKELDKRKQLDEFSKYSYVQLQDQLNKALDKEDYKQAELIKKEMAKRDAEKGMPSDKPADKPKDDLESKSIEELNKLKDEAVQKEDYQKAKEIQEIINKKKP